MQIGTVKQIWRYAVKSMAGEQLESCKVGTLGIPADRGWAIRDETTGEITNGKNIPLLMQCEARYRESPGDGAIPHVVMRFPDGVELTSDLTDVNARLSDLLGRSVSLWPRQPATSLDFYRRKSKMARAFGRLARFRAFRSAIPALTSFAKRMRIFAKRSIVNLANRFRICRRCRRKYSSSVPRSAHISTRFRFMC